MFSIVPVLYILCSGFVELSLLVNKAGWCILRDFHRVLWSSMKLDGHHLPDSFCQHFILCEYWAAQTEAGKDLNSDSGNWFCRWEEEDFLQPANAGYFWLYLSKLELDLFVGFDFFLQLMKGDLSVRFDFFLQLMKVSVFMPC